ncbi:hypothetical protein ACFSCV_16475 [Methylopila henanensis]|uniref:Uncharacterized protein n=1 Tax=Methylopila henanensis TaxID=873516 RepID=A0ABW4KC40_9HYPH
MLLVVVSGYDPSQGDRLTAETFANPHLEDAPHSAAGEVLADR